MDAAQQLFCCRKIRVQIEKAMVVCRDRINMSINQHLFEPLTSSAEIGESLDSRGTTFTKLALEYIQPSGLFIEVPGINSPVIGSPRTLIQCGIHVNSMIVHQVYGGDHIFVACIKRVLCTKFLDSIDASFLRNHSQITSP